MLDLNQPLDLFPSQSPASVAKQPQMRDFNDVDATRNAIFSNVETAFKTLPPAVSHKHELHLDGVKYIDPDHFTVKQQKEAILTGGTLGRRMQGTWHLLDKHSGQVLDSKKSIIGRVPYMTPRGTFINNGVEYAIVNQARLRPGVFTREKEDGETEAHVNVVHGKGPSHRYFLDPAKGVFYLNVGQSKIPLISLLRTLGADDKKLREAWGDDILAANYGKDNEAMLNKLYQKLVRKPNPDAQTAERKKTLVDMFAGMELDPEVTQRTLGKPYNKVDLPTILATTKKLLGISRGEADTDDRDHLAYQNFYGPEDLIAERVTRDSGGLRRGLLYKAGFKGNLKNMPSGALTPQLEAALHSGLGRALEEVNASELMDMRTKLTRMGEGGIASTRAIPAEARSVQPSQLGYVDSLRSPESEKVGVDSQIAGMARKGADGKLYTKFRDAKTGKELWRSPQDVADLTIAFPGTMKRAGEEGGMVAAMQKGKLRYVPIGQVDVELPNFEETFSPMANLVPLKSAVKGQRAVMASRMLGQALSLIKPEAPLVQSGIPGSGGKESYEERYGTQMGAIRAAAKPGRVMNVTADEITVRYDDGEKKTFELSNMLPYNRKSFEHHTPKVEPGQTFTPGQLLAKSNYTDDNGTTALGLNARVAYMSFRGKNHEDAITISESMAKRLTSDHLYQHGVDWKDPQAIKGLQTYIQLFPGKYDRKTLANFDEDGVIKPGTEVQEGQPLILLAKQKEAAKNRVHRQGESSFADHSETWSYDSPGVVTDVVKTAKGPTVVVRAQRPMQVGDKLSGRQGDKGLVGDIVPDDQMPRDTEGRPFEVLMNPMGTISRGNPSAIIEAALGKVAAKTGKPYKIEDFGDIQDLTEFAMQELQKNGIPDTEDVTDPASGRKVRNIGTGNRWFMKLHHIAEDKIQGRGAEGGYTSTGEPAKSNEQSSKRLSLQDTAALLSHGAPANLRDAHQIRGQQNQDFWLSFMTGANPPAPKVPMVYDRFVSEMKAAGINVVRKGTKTNIFALTDKDVSELAGDRELENAETVRFDTDLSPLKGGLFDPAKTGSHGGKQWSFIGLHEPLLNPVMEEPARKILGLTQKGFEAVLAGQKDLPHHGTGPLAIQGALKAIDLDVELEKTRTTIKGTRKTARDEALRKLGYLKSAKQLGIHPGDWVMSKVPVLPPAFRPVSVMQGNGQPLVSDANYLYRELFEANKNLAAMKGKVGDSDVGDERLALYNSYKALTGLADPSHPKLVEKGVKGLLKGVFGSGPKYSWLQRKLLSTPVDMVGRAVLTPNPDYDMDTVGVPEEKAWDLYKNFVVRRLHRRGIGLADALAHVKGRTDVARKELTNEMDSRPVLVDRAPILHKHGMLALRPQIVQERSLQLSPLVYAGFAADNDGDQMNFHVPVSDEARREALDVMLPSKSLISQADFKSAVHQPRQEFLAGLFAATRSPNPKKQPRVFDTVASAIAAYRRGELDIDDPVHVMQK